MKTSAIPFLLVFLFSSVATAASYRGANDLMNAWQMEDAQKEIDEMREAEPDNPEVAALQARHLFLSGKYKEASTLVDQALTQSPRSDWKRLKELVDSTHKVTEKYEKHLSPSKKFEIWIPPGKDKVLLPYAFDALDKAYDTLGEELGYYPPTPIRLEVYPKTKTLAAVSPLTEKDIRTSGTIALCKYNRLMITSPRALLRGYGWVDTIVHEYVHFVITKKTKNRVPIWMHEGLAKFLERRWRGKKKGRLPVSTAFMLQERVKAKDLITFAQMHPSMAKLPSQEDAAVAFAEVFTAMEYLQNVAGEGAFKTLLNHINEGKNAKKAFAETIGMPFSTFEKKWKASLSTRPKVEKGSGFKEKKIFKDDKKKPTELEFIREPKAKDYFRLGQMLQSRGKFKGAAVEYENAVFRIGDTNPQVQARLAQVYLEIRKPKKAIQALVKVALRHPEYVGTWLNLGRSYNQLSQYSDAKTALLEAARINPFDPSIHKELTLTLEGLGDSESAKKQQEFLRLLR